MSIEELRKNSKVSELAKRLRLDIAERSLQPGDHYITASAAGKMLGVSSAMANRAMNVLAETEILVRHRSRGTFVGPNFGDGPEAAQTVVHMVEVLGGGATSDLQASEMMFTLREVIPDARLVCHFFPENNSTRQICEEVERLAVDESFGGLILCSCRRDIQENIAKMNIPTVIWGSAYPGVDLSFVDLDQAEVGRLMAKQAVDAGYRRLTFVTRESWLEGDMLAFHGITNKAQKAGLGPNAVRLQNVPETSGESVIRSILEPMIQDAATRSSEPIAFLCRSVNIARQLYRISQSCDAWDPEKMMVVFDAAFENESQLPPGPFVKSGETLAEAFVSVAHILAENDTDTPRPVLVKLPVVCG